MATLQIKKKSLYTWLHIDSELGEFILSKFEFSEDGTKFQIVENNGAKRRIYEVTDIEVFDIAGGAETFVSITDLSLRLEELKYPAFNLGGTFVFDPANYDLSEFTNTEVNRFARLSDITGGITTTVTTITSANLTRQDATGLATYLNGLPSFNVPANDIRKYFVSDTMQVFELKVHGVNIGIGETPLTANDIIDNSVNLLNYQNRNLFPRSAYWWATGGNTATALEQRGALGQTALVYMGTKQNSVSTGQRLSYIQRLVYRSAATAGSVCGMYTGQSSVYPIHFLMPFWFSLRFDTALLTPASKSRIIAGIYRSTGDTGVVEPTTLLDCIVLANEAADTSFSIYHNDSSGVATKIPLGANYPSNVAGDSYELQIMFDGSNIFYRVQRWTSTNYVTYPHVPDFQTTGFIETNKPTFNQTKWIVHRDNVDVAEAVEIGVNSVECKVMY